MEDIIIIGGGAIGTSIARELSKFKLNITLLEKNTEVSQETTKANSAIIHGGYDTKPGTLKAKMNVEGNRMYGKLAEELDFEFKKIGSMVLAFEEEDMKILDDLYDRGMKNGVEFLEIISGDRARELDPFISEKVIGALHCPSAGIVDPFSYTYAMMENAMENGVKLKTQTEVIGLEGREDYVLVKTNNGEYKSRYVINAAGLYSDKVANMAGDEDFTIIPTKGVYRLLSKNKYEQLNKVLFQTPSEKGKGVLVTPTYAGNTMVGPTSERIDGEDVPTEEESLETIDELSKKSVPTLNLKRTIRIFTGIRAKPDTGDFMIYPSKKMKGLIHVGGIESPGLSSAPAIAEFVRDILENEGLELEIDSEFNPIRTGITRPNELSSKERENLISEDPTYENIICRCEQVTEGEILEAINRPAGAVSVDGVKRRVRAGMGMCQGNYCGPRVREILSRELGVPVDELPKEKKGSDLVFEFVNKK